MSDNKKIYCTHCGAENDFGVSQCQNCGTLFGVKSSIFRNKAKGVPGEAPAEEIPKKESPVEDEPPVETPSEDPVVETVAEEPMTEEPVEEPAAEEGATEPDAEKTAEEPATEEPAESGATASEVPPRSAPKTPAKDGFGTYFGRAITHPFESIKEATDEQAKYGWIVIAVTAILPALLVLLFSGIIFSLLRSTVLAEFGAEAYQAISFLNQQMGMVFLMVLIITVAEVLISLAIMYGISRGFGSKRTFRRWVAAYGSVRILVFIASLASGLVALIPMVGAVVAIPMSVVISSGYCVLLYKCFVAEMDATPSKKFYGYCLGLLVTMVAITILVVIVCVIMIFSIAAGIGGLYNHYTW